RKPATVPALDSESPKANPSTQAGISSAAPAETEGDEHAEETREEEPLDLLARAAGYSDYELWWERQIEQRRDLNNLFEGILEAMSALRTDAVPKDERE